MRHTASASASVAVVCTEEDEKKKLDEETGNCCRIYIVITRALRVVSEWERERKGEEMAIVEVDCNEYGISWCSTLMFC